MSSTGRYPVSEAKILQPLLRHPLGALAVHWFAQGLLQMDHTERVFKIGLDFLTTVTVAAVLRSWMSWPWAVLIAASASHTANWGVNGHIFVVLKHFGLVRHTRDETSRYLEGLVSRVRHEPSVQYAAVFGSVVRGGWGEASDLDVRLVRKPGVRAALRACWFALQERARATLRGFPLDLYVLDSFAPLGALRSDEPAWVLHDPERRSPTLGRPWREGGNFLEG